MNEVTVENVTPPPSELKHGTLWQHDDGEVYILCKLNHNAYCLIGLEDGNRWQEPEPKPADAFGTFRDEFTQITSGKITITPKP